MLRRDWERRIPWWWRIGCGFSRRCPLFAALLSAKEYRFLLWNGFLSKDGWVVRIEHGVMVLYPWPRRLAGASGVA